jgi:hypothetical protein
MKIWYYNFLLTWSCGVRSSQTTFISKLDVFSNSFEGDSIRGCRRGLVDKKNSLPKMQFKNDNVFYINT